jgi:hypothetical protein
VRGCQDALLYPPEHPGFAGALQRAEHGCRELLAVLPSCTLALDPSGPLLDGDLCPADSSLERFAARLEARGITVITLQVGVAEQEVRALVEILRAEPEAVAEAGGAEAWLSRAGVERIGLALPEVICPVPAAWGSFLAAQSATDRTALEALLAHCSETCRPTLPAGDEGADGDAMLSWLAEALGATAAELAAGSLARQSWLREVTRAVRQLAAALQGKLFRLPASSGLEVLGEVASLLEPQEAAEILVCHPSAVVGEPSERLEAVLRRLMSDPQRARELEPLVKSRLLSRGMTEESYQSVVSLVLKRNLAGAGGLEQEKRADGVRRLSLLADLLSSASPATVQESLVDTLLELTVASQGGDGRQVLVQRLAEALPASLAARDDGAAAELLRRVEETIRSGALSPAERRLLRARLAEGCPPECSRRLARFLTQEPRQENLVILWLVSQADDGLGMLLQVARGCSLPWLQGAVGSAIVQMGERSLEGCYRVLSSGPPEDAIALIRALVLSGTEEGLKRVWWAQEHTEVAVQVGLMEALAHSRDATAETALLGALERGGPELQSAAARSLGRHPSDQVVAALSAFLGGPLSLRRMGVTRSVCAALVEIGRGDCLPALRAMLRRRHVLLRTQAREAQALAAETLAALPHPEAERILRECAGGNSPEMATLCREALRRRLLSRTKEATSDGA